MKQILSVLIPALLSICLCHADEPVRERIEWMDVWVTNADQDDLPRVLLVGDSITRAYFDGVQKHLAGRANCARLTTSKCVSDPSFKDELRLLLDQYQFSVIHFNNGLHGWGYSEDQYRDGLRETIEFLKEHAGSAKVIWATTTPVRRSADVGKFGEHNPRVQARNQLAAEIMEAHGIPTTDLYGLAEPHADWYTRDGVHFNDEGRIAQAQEVARLVTAHLPTTTPRDGE